MKCGIARSSRKKTVSRFRCEVVLDDEPDRMRLRLMHGYL